MIMTKVLRIGRKKMIVMDFQTAANLLNVKWFYCNDRIPSAKVQEYTNALQLTNKIKYTVCTYIANK